MYCKLCILKLYAKNDRKKTMKNDKNDEKLLKTTKNEYDEKQ